MVNTEKFAVRLNKILEYYDISAAAFADKIEVGRSSISHILSGRNKPSLEFVMKIVKNFPEVELYWLLNGKGKFPAESGSNSGEENKTVQNKPAAPTPVSENTEKNSDSSIPQIPSTKDGRKIQKIVIFYQDGSFEAFEN